MAGSPELKIYSAAGDYLGCVKDYVHAAVLVSFEGKGATVRFGHQTKNILWTEWNDGTAAESYDHAETVMRERLHALHVAGYRKAHGRNPPENWGV